MLYKHNKYTRRVKRLAKKNMRKNDGKAKILYYYRIINSADNNAMINQCIYLSLLVTDTVNFVAYFSDNTVFSLGFIVCCCMCVSCQCGFQMSTWLW